MIQQLVSWGVTPEYLVGYGIAKETVALAFVELGFRLPPHLEYLVAPALHILSTVAPANASPSTSQIALPNGAGTTTPDQALIDMEKKRREELMARRTKRTAVEASIESLFSAAATTSADANGTTSGSRAGSATNSPPEMAIDDLRETIAAADELNPAPNGGPYASSALSPTTSLPTRSLPRRPVAVDFEADPTHAAASFVPPSRSTGFAPPPEMHRMQPLFLDLSDDEAEEDAEVAHTLAPTASTSMSEVVSKGERESLEAKEAEIKRMTEMITRMEKKAKKKVPPTLVATIEGGDAVMQDAAAAAATSSVPPTAALQEARSQVERLEGERQQLIDEVERRAASSPGKPDNTGASVVRL